MRQPHTALGRTTPHSRARTLRRLLKLFECHDAESEIRRLKAQDAGF